MLQEERGHTWTDGYLHLNLIIHQNGEAILQAEGIKLIEVAYTSTAIVRKEETFVDAMKALVKYAGSFSLHYKISFMDFQAKDVVEYMMSS